jgi:hypothetical protein
MINERIIIKPELKRIGGKRQRSLLRYYTCPFLGGAEKAAKNKLSG